MPSMSKCNWGHQKDRNAPVPKACYFLYLGFLEEPVPARIQLPRCRCYCSRPTCSVHRGPYALQIGHWETRVRSGENGVAELGTFPIGLGRSRVAGHASKGWRSCGGSGSIHEFVVVECGSNCLRRRRNRAGTKVRFRLRNLTRSCGNGRRTVYHRVELRRRHGLVRHIGVFAASPRPSSVGLSVGPALAKTICARFGSSYVQRSERDPVRASRRKPDVPGTLSMCAPVR